MGNNKLYENDYEKEIVKNVKKGCGRSITSLLNKYEPLIRATAGRTIYKFRDIPLEKEDIENQLRIELYKLTIKYKESINVRFSSYLNTALNGIAINYCRKFTTNKHKAANFSNQFNTDTNSYEEEFDYDELADLVCNELETMKQLTPKESKALKSYLQGIEPTIAAKAQGVSLSSFYRHLSNGKSKFRSIYPYFEI